MSDARYQISGVIYSDNAEDAEAIHRFLVWLGWSGGVKLTTENKDGSKTTRDVEWSA